LMRTEPVNIDLACEGNLPLKATEKGSREKPPSWGTARDGILFQVYLPGKTLSRKTIV